MNTQLRDFLLSLNDETPPPEQRPAGAPELDFIKEYPSIKAWVDEYCEMIQYTFEYADEHQAYMLSTGVYKAIVNQLYVRSDPTLNKQGGIDHWQKSIDKLNTVLALKGY